MFVGLHVNTRYYCEIFMKLNFLDRFLKNPAISNFTETRPVGAEFFHTDGRKAEYINTGRKLCPLKKEVG